MARSSALQRASVLLIAGGRGTRFRPASREAKPKPLSSIEGKTNLLADTIARHIPRVPARSHFRAGGGLAPAPFRRDPRTDSGAEFDRRSAGALYRGGRRLRRGDYQAQAATE
jgi:hypothetical protein